MPRDNPDQWVAVIADQDEVSDTNPFPVRTFGADGGGTEVEGVVSDGNPAGSVKPVVTGGVDAGGSAQSHRVDGDGTQHVTITDGNASAPVHTRASTDALSDGSGTIATGGVSQEIFPASATRRYLLIQNNSAGDLWVNFGVAAVQSQPSIKIKPDGHLEFESSFCPDQAVNVIGATTGQTFTAKQAT